MEVLLFALFFIVSLIFFISGKDDFGRKEKNLIIEDKEKEEQERRERGGRGSNHFCESVFESPWTQKPLGNDVVFYSLVHACTHVVFQQRGSG